MLKRLLSRPLRDDLLCSTALATGLGAYFYGVSAVFGPLLPIIITGLITSRVGESYRAARRKGVPSQFASATPFTADSSVGKAVYALAQRAGIEPPRVYLGDRYGARPLFHIIEIPPEALTESGNLRETALSPIAHETAHLKFDGLMSLFEYVCKRTLNATSFLLGLEVVGVKVGAFFFPSLPAIPVCASLGLIGLFNVLGHIGINYSNRLREVRADREAGRFLGQPDIVKDCLIGALSFYQSHLYSQERAGYGWAIYVHDLFSSHPSPLRRIRQIEKDALRMGVRHPPRLPFSF